MTKRRRKNTRLGKGCYRAPITCFVTMCVHLNQGLLGRVEGSSVVLSECGRRVEEIWLDIGRMNTNVDVSVYAILPNHFHGLIEIRESGGENTDVKTEASLNMFPDIIRNFKSFTTHEYNRMNHAMQLHLWQRGYNDHIIRDQSDYDRVKHYIQSNPSIWARDKFYLSDSL